MACRLRRAELREFSSSTSRWGGRRRLQVEGISESPVLAGALCASRLSCRRLTAWSVEVVAEGRAGKGRSGSCSGSASGITNAQSVLCACLFVVGVSHAGPSGSDVVAARECRALLRKIIHIYIYIYIIQAPFSISLSTCKFIHIYHIYVHTCREHDTRMRRYTEHCKRTQSGTRARSAVPGHAMRLWSEINAAHKPGAHPPSQTPAPTRCTLGRPPPRRGRGAWRLRGSGRSTATRGARRRSALRSSTRSPPPLSLSLYIYI